MPVKDPLDELDDILGPSAAIPKPQAREKPADPLAELDMLLADDRPAAKAARAPGAASVFAGGFNARLADMAEVPEWGMYKFAQTRPGGAIYRGLTGDEPPTAPYEDYAAAESAAGKRPFLDFMRGPIMAPQPTTAGERVAYEGGKELGTNLPLLLTGTLGAPAMVRATEPAVRQSLGYVGQKLAPFVNPMFKGIAEAPKISAAADMTASAGAGIGRGIAQEAWPGNSGAATAGEIAGAIAPSLSTFGMYKAGKGAFDAVAGRFSPSLQKERAAESVADAIFPEPSSAMNAADEAILARQAQVLGNIDRAADLSANIPNFKPSLPEATGSPALIATQRNMERQSEGPELDAMAGRRDANVAAVRDEAQRRGVSEFGVDNNIQSAFDVTGRRFGALDDQLSRAEQSLDVRRATQAAGLPTVSMADKGDSLRASIDEARKATKKRMGQVADEFGLNNKDLSADITKFRDEVAEKYGPQGPLGDKANVPAAYTDLVNIGRRTPDNMRVMLKELRSGMSVKPESLMAWVKRMGGLKDDGGELAARNWDKKGRFNIARKNGRSMDELADLARQEGYFPDKDAAGADDLLKALDQEARGQPVYKQGGDGTAFDDSADVLRAQEMDKFQHELDMAGVDLNLPDDEIVRRMEFYGGKQPAAVTFKDVMEFRSRLGDDIRDEIGGANPSRKKLRTLVGMQRDLDKFIDDALDSQDPGLKDDYASFRQMYRDEYIIPFESGAAADVSKRMARGDYRNTGEDVAEAFWSPGDETSARQFKQIFGERGKPEHAELAAIAMDSLRRDTVRGDQVKPALLEAWKRKYAANLREFPDIAKMVGDVDAVTAAIEKRAGQLTRRRQVIENDMLKRELSAFDKGKPADQVLNALLADERKMGKFVQSIRGDKAAMNAARRNVWDAATNFEKSPEQMLQWLKTNRRSLGHLYTQPHLRSLEELQEAIKMATSVPKSAGRPISTNPMGELEETIGTPMNSLASRAFAAESGRTSWRYVFFDLFGRAMRGYSARDADAIFRNALEDPAAAARLAGLVRKRNQGIDVSKLLPQVKSWMFTVGTDSGEDE